MKQENQTYVLTNRSVARQVAEILTNKIIEGKIKVGDFLPTEEELCQEFNIGRSSVREAIKTLESRGMVRKHAGKGVIVIDEVVEATSDLLRLALDFHKTSLKDLMNFRVALEIKSVEFAAQNATNEDLEQMKECVDKMRDEELSIDQFATYDYLFHESIAKASGNNVSLIIMKTLRPLLYNQIVYTLNPSFNPEQSLHFHEAIYDAIKSKEPKRAVVEMTRHLVETQTIINSMGNI